LKFKWVSTIALLMSICVPITTHAEPPAFFEKNQDQGNKEPSFLFGTPCEGKTDIPHKSTHVPGTVNVQARTTCPGKGVEISTRLTRTYRGVKVSATKSNHGISVTSVNVSMKCIWKKGMKKIKYEVSSTHRLYDGQVGYTSNYNYLEC